MQSLVPAPRPQGSPFAIVVVAASLGGMDPLKEVLGALPEDFPAPVAVVQHRRTGHPCYLEQILARRTRLAVRQAHDGDPLRPGTVYVAPPNLHLRVSGGVCALSAGPELNHVRPAADALFASAAERFGEHTLAVVLTGRGQDGAAGAAAVRRHGGVVVVQEPATCRAPEMPRAVLSECGADFVLPPDSIGRALVSLAMVPGVPALFGLARTA